MPAPAAPPAWAFPATVCCRSRRSASATRSASIPAWSSCRGSGPTRSSRSSATSARSSSRSHAQDYQSGAPRPYQLFSHSDQVAQWQTSIADRVGQTGWGGRTADRFALHGSGFPMITALSGGIFTRGQTSSPLSIASAPTALNQVLVLNGFGTAADEVARRSSMDVLRDDRQRVHAGPLRQPDDAAGRRHRPDAQERRDAGDGVSEHDARQSAEAGGEGHQGQRRRSPTLGLNRQIFFCQLGGFDTHQNQVGTQSSLLAQVKPGNQGVLRRDHRARAGSPGHDIHPVGLRPHAAAGRHRRERRVGSCVGQSPPRCRRRGAGRRLLWRAGTERQRVPGAAG